ncbi:hypothetical protein ACWEOE_30575 [Amycolatopsis sp. NPDC004368]
MASGQVVGLLRDVVRMADLIAQIAPDAEAILRRLGGGGCA